MVIAILILWFSDVNSLAKFFKSFIIHYYHRYPGKYASKEENTEDKERIKEKRRLITGNLGNHEKYSLI